MESHESALLPELASGELSHRQPECEDTSEFPVLRTLEEIECLVAALVASWNISPSLLQKRNWHRVGFHKPIGLTPLDDRSFEPVGQPTVMPGRDISLHGISFVHQHPLPYRTVAVTFLLQGGNTESIVTRLTWCRYTRDGYYHSGGKFVKTVALPNDNSIDWDGLLRAETTSPTG